VLKIETRQAFEQPPQLLLTAMLHPKIGVMIARVDLAVECGYERLAEFQEEILWLCEAAHLPIIWATQVREQLTKRGQPSLAEISDAAMSDIRLRVVPLRHVPGIPALVVGARSSSGSCAPKCAAALRRADHAGCAATRGVCGKRTHRPRLGTLERPLHPSVATCTAGSKSAGRTFDMLTRSRLSPSRARLAHRENHCQHRPGGNAGAKVPGYLG
jgi:hypothetical protein